MAQAAQTELGHYGRLGLPNQQTTAPGIGPAVWTSCVYLGVPDLHTGDLDVEGRVLLPHTCSYQPSGYQLSE